MIFFFFFPPPTEGLLGLFCGSRKFFGYSENELLSSFQLSWHIGDKRFPSGCEDISAKIQRVGGRVAQSFGFQLLWCPLGPSRKFLQTIDVYSKMHCSAKFFQNWDRSVCVANKYTHMPSPKFPMYCNTNNVESLLNITVNGKSTNKTWSDI